LIFFDLFLFNILIFVIILFDSFSYFTGLLFGKRYIFKKISPKKTLEGYLGGGFFTNIIIITFLLLFKDNINIINILLLINSIIIFSIAGDLTQSFFKRINNIKNSSSYLPGHGGFFDRFDSFIPSIIFLLLYSI
jgi:phosphatidate cytidylyltransferase